MKKNEIKRILESSLPYPRMTIWADQRFDALSAMLEEQPGTSSRTQKIGLEAESDISQAGELLEAEPTVRRRRRPVLKLCFSLAALALVFLFVLNLTQPSLTEALPGMGGLFQAFNKGLSGEEDTSVSSSPEEPRQILESEAPYRISLTDAFCEGSCINVSLRLETEDAGLLSALWLSPYIDPNDPKNEEYSVTVNGQKAKLLTEITFDREENGFDCRNICIELPFPAENGQKLAVELRLDTLWGIKGDYSTGVTSQSEMITEEPVAFSFEVTADTTANRSGESASTADGITFVGFESTPLYFKAKLSYPAILQTPLSRTGELVHVEARTEDGGELYYAAEANEWPEPGTYFPGEVISHTAAFSGVPSTAGQVIVTLYNTYSQETVFPYVDGGVIGACVFAEFTVDLNTGEVAATETYLERGYENFSISDYTATMTAGPQFVDHMFDHQIQSGFGRDCLQEEESAEPDSKPSPLRWTVFFYSDTDGELPYEVRFYIQGELYQTVPLCRTEDSVDTETGYMTIREESDLRVEDIDPEKCGLTDAVKRIYHASAYFEGDLDDSGYDLVSLANYQIVNTETEEVLFDYSSYERPMHFFTPPGDTGAEP